MINYKMKLIINKVLKNLLSVISWIIFPPIFLYILFQKKTLSWQKKMIAYFSIIISPFTIVVLLTMIGLGFQNNDFSIEEMEKSLNIEIEGDYSVEKNKIIWNGRQDYKATIIIKLTDESLSNLVGQIEKSKYFNLKQEFYGNDELKWKNSDTIMYWNVRNYLEEEKLTGYWVRQDSLTLEFYEPTFSDIPNSAILFHEAYIVEANLSKKDRILKFEYTKY